jgi:hypothetical protein
MGAIKDQLRITKLGTEGIADYQLPITKLMISKAD